MSDEYPTDSATLPGGFKMDAFIPLVILSIGFIVLLAWQISINSNQHDQLENAITRQEPAVTQSQQVQDRVSKLVADLLAAAQTDDGAKAIVAKFKIQASGSTDAAASPTP